MSQFSVGDRVRVPHPNPSTETEAGVVIDVPDSRVPAQDERLEPVRVYIIKLESGLVRRYTGGEIEAE